MLFRSIEWGGRSLGVAALLEQARELTLEKPLSAGRWTACRVIADGERGVARFEFAPGLRIGRVRFISLSR